MYIHNFKKIKSGRALACIKFALNIYFFATQIQPECQKSGIQVHVGSVFILSAP